MGMELSRWWARFRLPGRISVYFERSSSVGRVRDNIIGCLKHRVYLKEAEDEHECDVRVFFCPIVSRAGTDISAVLSRVRDDKPTCVLVLQHTFDKQAIVPSVSEYERERLILVTFLFSEDYGLLECLKNKEAFDRATHYLKKWASEKDGSGKNILTYVLATAMILGFLFIVPFVWRRIRSLNRPVFWSVFVKLFNMANTRPVPSKQGRKYTIQNLEDFLDSLKIIL